MSIWYVILLLKKGAQQLICIRVLLVDDLLVDTNQPGIENELPLIVDPQDIVSINSYGTLVSVMIMELHLAT